MSSTYVFLYDLLIRLYRIGIRISAPLSPKAKRWLQGREKLYSRLSVNLSSIHGPRIWVHCASLGEFEQARPLMEALRQRHPGHKIILTFFSPSGYDVRRYSEGVDYVSYLPIDTEANARRLITMIKPSLVIWVKYDYWYHYLHRLHAKGIPVILISAAFRREHIFFTWYGGLHRAMLGFFTHIFVQNEESKELLRTISVASTVCPDTRFDRVAAIAGQRKAYENIAAFKGDKKILIAGSTWARDADLLCRLINEDPFQGRFRYIIAPHEVNEKSIAYITDRIKKPVTTFSRITTRNAQDYTVAVIDGIGALSSLYYYGDVAYIGGGFGVSIHNILEPAVYGMPVIFGPHHQKSLEAQTLLSHPDWHAAYSIRTYEELVSAITSLLADNEANLQTGKKTSQEYVMNHTGGTDMIYDYLLRSELL